MFELTCLAIFGHGEKDFSSDRNALCLLDGKCKPRFPQVLWPSRESTVELHLSGRWLSRSPIIRIGLALWVYVSRILQIIFPWYYRLSNQIQQVVIDSRTSNLLVSLRSSNSCLRLLPCHLVTSSFLSFFLSFFFSTFSSITRFRKQFLRKT
jgi:hypothetical protein